MKLPENTLNSLRITGLAFSALLLVFTLGVAFYYDTIRSEIDNRVSRGVMEVWNFDFSDQARSGDVLADSEVSDGVSEELQEGLVSDLYVVYDGVTIVLPPLVLETFYRSHCPMSKDCAADLPCIDVNEIREYVKMNLVGLLDGYQETAIAKNAYGQFEYKVSDFGPDREKLITSLVEKLTLRAELYRQSVCGMEEESVGGLAIEESDNVIDVEKKEMPGTDGRYVIKYIEIDDSQQHLYVWERGLITDDYEISGFYDEYSVYGVFSIVEKSKNAWSPMAEKWMPFWMAYYYEGKQEAWFGIHELVYWTDEDGVFHEESSDSIGSKKSGGCIRLDRGEAEELYNDIEVGTPVLIHK